MGIVLTLDGANDMPGTFLIGIQINQENPVVARSPDRAAGLDRRSPRSPLVIPGQQRTSRTTRGLVQPRHHTQRACKRSASLASTSWFRLTASASASRTRAACSDLGRRTLNLPLN